MQIVRLIKPYMSFNPGEMAGFSDPVAADLVEHGYGEIVEPVAPTTENAGLLDPFERTPEEIAADEAAELEARAKEREAVQNTAAPVDTPAVVVVSEPSQDAVPVTSNPAPTVTADQFAGPHNAKKKK